MTDPDELRRWGSWINDDWIFELCGIDWAAGVGGVAAEIPAGVEDLVAAEDLVVAVNAHLLEDPVVDPATYLLKIAAILVSNTALSC